jgi:hypothetical protein
MIQITKEMGEYVADAPACLVHAFGATPEEARTNLLVELDEQHRRFIELHAVGRLSKHLSDTIPTLEETLAALASET